MTFYDILCRMTFVIVCHKMTFMTDVIWHQVSWTIAIWVSNEPSRLVQWIYSIQNHFLFWFLDTNPKYQNANISLCNSLSKTKRPKNAYEDDLESLLAFSKMFLKLIFLWKYIWGKKQLIKKIFHLALIIHHFLP